MNRYIKSVTLKNFQSYKNQTIQFQPGLNLLLGTSDSGKSAILRAISFVLYNHPKKDTLIHWGEKETEVTVEFSDGVKVTRIKGEGKNDIIAIDSEGKKIPKIKIDKDIPDDIKELLGNPPQDDFNGLISYADQFSPMFLVDLSPTDLPRSLSGLTGIEILEESAKQLMSNYKALDKQNKIDEKEYSVLLNESQAYSYIDTYEKKIENLSEKLLDISNLEEKISIMDSYVKDFNFNIDYQCVEAFDKIIDKIVSSLDRIKNIQNIVADYNKLQVFNLIEHKDVDETSLTILDSCIEKIERKLENFKSNYEQVENFKIMKKISENVSEIKQKGEALKNEYNDLKSSLEKAEEDYDNFKKQLVKMGIQCETCGSLLQ
jgi:exonuclease SbcC